MRWSLVLITLVSFPIHAQDVYNFYFQKSQGSSQSTSSQTVQKVEELNRPTEAKVETTLPVVQPAKSEYKNWELTLSRSWMAGTAERGFGGPSHDDGQKTQGPVSEGYSIFTGYRMNRYVSWEAGVHMGAKLLSEEDKEVTKGQTINGSIGVSLIPFHLNVFGFDLLEIGITAGIMTGDHFEIQEYYGAEGATNYSDEEPSKRFMAYGGPRVALNFTQNISAVLDAKASSERFGGIASVGLRYRFQ